MKKDSAKQLTKNCRMLLAIAIILPLYPIILIVQWFRWGRPNWEDYKQLVEENLMGKVVD